jgi:hypothetical protein
MLRTCNGTAVGEGDGDVAVDPDVVEAGGFVAVGPVGVASAPPTDPGESRFVTISAPTAMAATVTAARVPTASRTPDDRCGLSMAAACPFDVRRPYHHLCLEISGEWCEANVNDAPELAWYPTSS